METKKECTTQEIFIEDINATNTPLKDPGTDEGLSEQMS
ncbi:MAG: hypothetical protein RLZZ414_1316 [Bacteroidota bacterium]|jgi:hypothetical protein